MPDSTSTLLSSRSENQIKISMFHHCSHGRCGLKADPSKFAPAISTQTVSSSPIANGRGILDNARIKRAYERLVVRKATAGATVQERQIG